MRADVLSEATKARLGAIVVVIIIKRKDSISRIVFHNTERVGKAKESKLLTCVTRDREGSQVWTSEQCSWMKIPCKATGCNAKI